MNVWVVVEFMIDDYYRIWGVYSSKEKAIEIKEKLEAAHKKYRPYDDIDGDIEIVETTLDGTDVYEHNGYRITKDGKIIESWKRFHNNEKQRGLYDYYNNLVLIIPVNKDWKPIYEKIKKRWGDQNYLKEVLK